MSRAYVFPDTNIALHYRRLDQINWCGLVGAEEVVLVLTTVFLGELDRKGYDGSKTVKNRARSLKPWLHENIDKMIRAGVHLEVSTIEPATVINFAAQNLHEGNQDDQHLAFILAHRAKHPESEVLCATADLAMSMKAKARSVRYFTLPEDHRLAEEPDESEIAARQLRKELDELKNARPILELSFEGGGAVHPANLSVFTPMSPTEIDRDLRRARARAEEAGARFLASIFKTPKQRAEYESDEEQAEEDLERMAKYLDGHRAWLADYSTRKVAQSLTLRLAFNLSNTGTGPAEDVEIYLSVPEGMDIARRRKLDKLPRRPELPRPYGLSAMMDAARIPMGKVLSIRSFIKDPVRFIGDDEPRRVRIHVDRLKQHEDVKLPPVAVWFNQGAPVGGFAVPFRVVCASLPRPIVGELNVRAVATDAGAVVPPDEGDGGEEEESGDEDD